MFGAARADRARQVDRQGAAARLDRRLAAARSVALADRPRRAQDIGAALGSVGDTFVLAVMVMAAALASSRCIDVPVQIVQRMQRLRMTKQEVKDEHKQTEGSPELKAGIRRRQREIAARLGPRARWPTRRSCSPTRPISRSRCATGRAIDAAPVVVARGRGATADAIRELAAEHKVPMLSYPAARPRRSITPPRAGQVDPRGSLSRGGDGARLRLQPRDRDRRGHAAEPRRAARGALRRARRPRPSLKPRLRPSIPDARLRSSGRPEPLRQLGRALLEASSRTVRRPL